eukprot:58804_1
MAVCGGCCGCVWFLSIIAAIPIGFGLLQNTRVTWNDVDFQSNCIHLYNDDIDIQPPTDLEFDILNVCTVSITVVIACVCCYSCCVAMVCKDSKRWDETNTGMNIGLSFGCLYVLATLASASIFVHVFLYLHLLNQEFEELSPLMCYIDDQWCKAYDWALAGVFDASFIIGIVCCFCFYGFILGATKSEMDEGDPRPNAPLPATANYTPLKRMDMRNTNNNNLIDKCRNNLSECKHAQTLIANLRHYDHVSPPNRAISHIINDYIHTLNNHDEDQEFQFIVDQLEACDATKCKSLARIRRNRYSPPAMNTQYLNKNKKDIAYNDIVSKIHCYFMHSHDIGYRLRLHESSRDYNTSPSQDDGKYNSPAEMLVDRNLSQTSQLLKTQSENSTLNIAIGRENKFNQFVADAVDQSQINGFCNFHHGYSFKYKDYQSPENMNPNVEYVYSDHATISPRHKSFKAELTQNEICLVTMDQFNNEYTKANVHFNSFYRRKAKPNMTMDHILALLFYCNYSVLSYEFTKTYRENDGKHHTNYYYWGLYLKQAVIHHGTGWNTHNPTQPVGLFHGLSEQLLLHPTVIFDADDIIYSPLSATSSLPVAIRFADTDGIIVQLSHTSSSRIIDQVDSAAIAATWLDNTFDVKDTNCAHYFSVAWLSDFPGEKEYLFLQDNEFEGLCIWNILSPITGHRLQYLMIALTVIKAMVCNGPSVQGSYDEIINRYQLWISQWLDYHEISTKLQDLVVSIMMSEFHCNQDYANKMVMNCCNSITEAVIDVQRANTVDYVWNIWYQMFKQSKYEYIDITAIVEVFPKMNQIVLENMIDSDCSRGDILKDVLDSWQNVNKQSHIRFVQLAMCPEKTWIQKYKDTYKGIVFGLATSQYVERVGVFTERRSERKYLTLISTNAEKQPSTIQKIGFEGF